MNTIQFNTIINDGVIQIPEQYLKLIPLAVNVTIIPTGHERQKFKPKTKEKPLNIDEFPAILETKDWKFNREEANERR